MQTIETEQTLSAAFEREGYWIHHYDAMKEKETSDILSNAGFAASEIARLQLLQRDYVKDTFSHLSAIIRRHKFSS